VHLVVGLGNPGRRYSATRHNVGFDVAERLAERWSFGAPSDRFGSLAADGRIGDARAIIARPQRFMNCSGGPVAALAGFHKVPADHTVVVHDEVDLPFGQVRVKAGGGHGGHNGLRDLVQHFAADFLRVRVGVGRPPEGWDTADYVLGRWTPTEQEALPAVIDTAADAVEAVLQDGALAAMNRFNVRPERPAKGRKSSPPPSETVPAANRPEEP
jgi:peptidyl-tRNA hydrolase, PTH1 family